ncbi:hypothetical protein PG984_006527 [Apiospora sp. TS-2023a]
MHYGSRCGGHAFLSTFLLIRAWPFLFSILVHPDLAVGERDEVVALEKVEDARANLAATGASPPQEPFHFCQLSELSTVPLERGHLLHLSHLQETKASPFVTAIRTGAMLEHDDIDPSRVHDPATRWAHVADHGGPVARGLADRDWQDWFACLAGQKPIDVRPLLRRIRPSAPAPPYQTLGPCSAALDPRQLLRRIRPSKFGKPNISMKYAPPEAALCLIDASMESTSEIVSPPLAGPPRIKRIFYLSA